MDVAEFVRPVRPFVARVEGWQLRRFGRSILSVAFRTEVLLLSVPGRRSRVLRSTPLAYIEVGDGWLISGGAGGQAKVDWIANLRAAGRATVTIHRRSFEVLARELVDEEYDAMRRLAICRWPRIRTYERRAGRSVPLFLLHQLSGTTGRNTGDA